MKIEIDTEKLAWIEVPGRPTLGSFLNYNLHARGSSPPKGFPDACRVSLLPHTLVKVAVPSYVWPGTVGYVPDGKEMIRVMFLAEVKEQFGQPVTLALSQHGPERIIAFTNDVHGPLLHLFDVLSGE